jgi:hypothetical protein
MSEHTEDFESALQRWLEGAQAIITQNHKRLYPDSQFEPDALTVERGLRYTKIVITTNGGKGQRSVHAFIDRNGDVLKPASWKTPAKHARGNIYDESDGLASMSPYGPAYLR